MMWNKRWLWQVLQQPPPDGGLWNGRKVADWMSELKGKKIGRGRGWEYLKSMNFRLRVPRPEHQESDIRRTCRNGKKSASVRIENQEREPRKRRRSLVNGRTSARVETYSKTRMGG